MAVAYASVPKWGLLSAGDDRDQLKYRCDDAYMYSPCASVVISQWPASTGSTCFVMRWVRNKSSSSHVTTTTPLARDAAWLRFSPIAIWRSK